MRTVQKTGMKSCSYNGASLKFVYGLVNIYPVKFVEGFMVAVEFLSMMGEWGGLSAACCVTV